MRKSKFSDCQIMDALKLVEAGFAVPDICLYKRKGLHNPHFCAS